MPQQLHGCQYYGDICQVVQTQNRHPKAGSFPKFVKEQSVAADIGTQQGESKELKEPYTKLAAALAFLCSLFLKSQLVEEPPLVASDGTVINLSCSREVPRVVHGY